ncbi:thiol:disulfide interchange protein TlpA [Terrihabitans sp. B22-R8]|uniref:thiol:disulfide interchange protein TlpA n=1 Tax=Terrihabitans sp. B22-R8 TaxID=3425128 RepID=UPI00403C6350
MTDETHRPRNTLRTIALLAVLGAAVGVGAVYVKTGFGGNESAATCAGDPAVLARMKPLARGEVAGVLVPDAPRPLPELAFTDTDGQPKTLKDFAGRTVLLNIWATWCAPCREEMPALDRLQGELSNEAFDVVAVTIDTQDEQKARDFLAELKVEHLKFYADRSTNVFQTLKRAGRAVGLPTTILIDGNGCEIGYLPGPAEWDSDDGKALIRAATGS